MNFLLTGAQIPAARNWDILITGEELYELWSTEKISSREFLQRSGLKKATFYNMITECRNGLNNIEEYKHCYKCS